MKIAHRVRTGVLLHVRELKSLDPAPGPVPLLGGWAGGEKEAIKPHDRLVLVR